MKHYTKKSNRLKKHRKTNKSNKGRQTLKNNVYRHIKKLKLNSNKTLENKQYGGNIPNIIQIISKDDYNNLSIQKIQYEPFLYLFSNQEGVNFFVNNEGLETLESKYKNTEVIKRNPFYYKLKVNPLYNPLPEIGHDYINFQISEENNTQLQKNPTYNFANTSSESSESGNESNYESENIHKSLENSTIANSQLNINKWHSLPNERKTKVCSKYKKHINNNEFKTAPENIREKCFVVGADLTGKKIHINKFKK